MIDQYFIEGKRVNQKQWYAHLETKYQELHELLAAEQAKSAELERQVTDKQEHIRLLQLERKEAAGNYERASNLRTRLENEIQIANNAMALGCEALDGYKQRNSDLQASIAAMRDLLEELVVASEEDDVEHCVFGGKMHRLKMYIAPSFIEDCRKALSNTAVLSEVNQ